MLALGASDLGLRCRDSSEMNSLAMTHRIRAVGLLNQAILAPPKEAHELDARFATLLILTFQSACMSEGLTDFLTMLRGCYLQETHQNATNSYFASLEHDHLIAVMDRRILQAQLEALDSKCLDQVMLSLTALGPFCKPGMEQQFLNHLCRVTQLAYTSPSSGQFCFIH